MAIDTVQPSATRMLEFPAEAVEDVERTASHFGLKPASYLLLLHAARSGSVDPSMMDVVQRIFTEDRDILKELAK